MTIEQQARTCTEADRALTFLQLGEQRRILSTITNLESVYFHNDARPTSPAPRLRIRLTQPSLWTVA